MTIIDFYKNLSRILTDCRERFTSKEEASNKLKLLLEEAKESKLEVEISDSILEERNLILLDDENSFTEPDFQNDDSSDYDSSDYDSSYSY